MKNKFYHILNNADAQVIWNKVPQLMPTVQKCNIQWLLVVSKFLGTPRREQG